MRSRSGTCIFALTLGLMVGLVGCDSLGDGDGTSVVSNGLLRIHVSTENTELSGGYTIDVSGDEGYSTRANVSPNDSLRYQLPVGRYEVTLSGLTQNCSSEGETTVNVALQENGTSSVEFRVTCVADSRVGAGKH